MWERVGGEEIHSLGSPGLVNLQPETRLRNVSRKLMKSKDVPQSQFPPTSVSQSMFRTNRGTVGGYFLAGRSMVWWPVRKVGGWNGRDPGETA